MKKLPKTEADGRRGEEGYAWRIVTLTFYSIRISNHKRKPFKSTDMIQWRGICVKRIELGKMMKNINKKISVHEKYPYLKTILL